MDEKREAEVWQRVAAQPRGGGVPEGLFRESASLAAGYRRLAGTLTGRGQELARQLTGEEEAIAACLRGILLLSGGTGEQIKHWESAGGNRNRLLQSWYHRTRRCREAYMARSLEPDFGEVYRQLADRAARQCSRLAELLGSIG